MSISSKELLKRLQKITQHSFGAGCESPLARRLVFALFLLKFLEEREISLPKPLSSLLKTAQNTSESNLSHFSLFLEENRNALRAFTLFPKAEECKELIQTHSFLPLLTSLQELNDSHPIEDLSYIYEQFLLRDRNIEGSFYTPQPLVDEITTNALKPLLERTAPAQILELKILDPACGAGLFLLRAARQLNAFAFQNSLSLPNDALYRNCLHGVDKDRSACELSRMLLACLALESKQLTLFPRSTVFFGLLTSLEQNICAGDSLIDDRNCLSGHAEQESFALEKDSFSWSKAFPEIIKAGGFNCIIGNPPYGLSRDQQISSAENAKLKLLYQEYLCGKLNKYMLFMVRGYQLLRSGGTLSFVVPNSWLGIRSAMLIRKLFITNRCLHDLTILQPQAFEGLSVEAVVFRVDKGTSYRSIEVTPPAGAGETRARFRLPYKACEASGDFIIPVGWSDSVRSVLRRLHRGTIRLDSSTSPFNPMIALQAYALGKGIPPQEKETVEHHLFHAKQKLDEHYHRYLEGADIKRYGLKWSDNWLRYGAWLAEPQNLERFSGPRIMAREVLSQAPYLLNCAFTDKIYLYNKSVLHILPKNAQAPESSMLLWALLAVLNSKLASFVILQRGRKAQREIFPKIVNDDLKDFPLPQVFSDKDSGELKRLAGLAQERASLEKQYAVLDQVLDQEVYALYRLSDKHISSLEESLAPKSRNKVIKEPAPTILASIALT